MSSCILPDNFVVTEKEKYGRGVSTMTSIRAGTKVRTDEPYAYVLNESSRGVLCDCCFEAGNLQRCGQCKHVYYCGRNCQKKDWSLHKIECKGLASIRPNKPSDTMRLVIRILLTEGKEKSATVRNKTEQMITRTFSDLCSHEDLLSDEVKSEVALQVIGVKKLLEGSKDIDPKTVYSTICKVMCNAFNIFDNELNPVGTGIYLVPSLLNHSCKPNCVVVFTGLKLSIRCIEEIKFNNMEKPQEMFISYTELLDTRERRQAHLMKVYSFECTCERCTSGEGEDLMLSTVSDDVTTEKRDRVMREGFQRLDGDIKTWSKNKDYAEVASLAEKLLGEYSSILHPLNIVCVKLQEELLLAQIGLGQWEKALATAEKLTKPYQQYLPSKYHHTNVLHLVRLGKLRRAIGTTEQLELSIRDLTQVMYLLHVSHGGDHPLTAETSLMLQDSQGELVQRKIKPLMKTVQKTEVQ